MKIFWKMKQSGVQLKRIYNRGLIADDAKKVDTPRTAKQKASLLKLMLGTIASYAPVIARDFIVSETRCLDDIWNKLRSHFGFRRSGALILDVTSISREEGESYEALWQRTYAFITDNLRYSSTQKFRHNLFNTIHEERQLFSDSLGFFRKYLSVWPKKRFLKNWAQFITTTITPITQLPSGIDGLVV